MNPEIYWDAHQATTGKLVARHYRSEGLKGKKIWWTDDKGITGLPSGIGVIDLALYRPGKNTVGSRIVVVEGEKCTDCLVSLGIDAAGTVCGAAATPVDAALKPLIDCSEVILWPDNDVAGRKHMNNIGSRLLSLGAKKVRLVNWEGAPDKGDCVDAVDAGIDVLDLITESDDFQPLETANKAIVERKRDRLPLVSAYDLSQRTSSPIEFICEP